MTCWRNTPVKTAIPLRYMRLSKNYSPAPRWTAWNTHGKATPIISALLGLPRQLSNALLNRKWLFKGLDDTQAKWSVVARCGQPARCKRGCSLRPALLAVASLLAASEADQRRGPVRKRFQPVVERGYAGGRAPAFAFPLETTREEPGKKFRGAHKWQKLGLSLTGTAGCRCSFRVVRTISCISVPLLCVARDASWSSLLQISSLHREAPFLFALPLSDRQFRSAYARTKLRNSVLKQQCDNRSSSGPQTKPGPMRGTCRKCCVSSRLTCF